MKDNIVEILISQHNLLRESLESILELLEDTVDSNYFIEIDKILKKYNKDLSNHLNLENNVFYPDLLGKMNKMNSNINDTEKFIEEMKIIEKKIMIFLDKFKDVENIKNNLEIFRNDFLQMKEMLFLRIESEESGVYSYWIALLKQDEN